MDIFSKLFSSLFLFQSLLALLFPLAAAQNSNLFREYIGAQDKGVKFTDVPINPDVEFHFILAFAIDYTNPTSPTDGIFNIFWDNVNLSASAVSSIKQSNSNVKVALSLGGYTVDGSDTIVTFHPTSVDTWVDNAVSSLTTIIQQYNLDGIDIDYERFNDGTDPDTFAECIGRLLTTLKSNGVIEFASIAPYLEPLESYYKALWGKYSELIDYVNFQFYGYPAGMTVSEFLSSYETQRTNYDGGKVLASFISNGSLGGLSPQNGFFNACETLQSKGELPGIVVWSADTSKNTGNGFQYEKQAQELLANAN